MTSARFVPRIEGFYEARSLPGVQNAIRDQCRRIVAEAGPGYGWNDQQGRKNPQGRWRGTIYPVTYLARRDNLRNNTLARILGG